MSTFSEALKEAIRSSGTSRYAIARETGLSQSLLCRFPQGTRGLSLESIDRLMDALGLEIRHRERERN
jgi:transcriptional regulator with XRE-family HTH domain